MQNADIAPSLLATLVPIKALGAEHCRELAKQSELCSFTKGEVLFKEDQDMEYIIYVLRGDVQMIRNGEPGRQIQGGSRASKLPLVQGKKAQETALALGDVVCVMIDPDTLDIMLTWDQSGGYQVEEIDKQTPENDESDWMARLLQAKVFHKIPPANIQSVFMSMETHHYKAGEYVIRQGEEGDQFYIIREGKCQVTRKTRKNPEGMVLANLGPGDNFGEEALISGGKRNASIHMLTDGVLMSLSKTEFLELLNDPLLKWVPYSEARQLAADGAIWIDVRLPAEYQAQHIAKSVNIPLPLLRTKLDKLDRKLRYLLYCDSGRRSSIATYLLSQNGFDAYILRDPLSAVPTSEIV